MVLCITVAAGSRRRSGGAVSPAGRLHGRAYTSDKDWRVERGVYRLIGVDPRSEQTWPAYLRSVVLVSGVGIFLLYGLQRLQRWLPFSLDVPTPSQHLSFNTAISFVTNTNWQSYSGEQTLGYTVQFAGLAVQGFISAAVGMAVAIALVRGFARTRATVIGNFWVDLTRGVLRILLPIAVIGAVLLITGGVIQNLAGFSHVTTLTGATQRIPGGPVASQESIKLLGTNGGGFYDANSAHPFENPSPLTNFVEIILMLAIPFSLPRAFGTMVGDHRQGYAILSTMGIIWVASLSCLIAAETSLHGIAVQLAGGAMEGKEQRFGIIGSTLFTAASTGTSTGAVNSALDSFTALVGMMAMLNNILGEVAPGGAGSGLYGMLILAVIAVFISGLLTGRTPEDIGKKIGPREMKLAALYILITPTLVLAGTVSSFIVPGVRTSVTGTSILNPGVHGMSEVLHGFTSAANNNGSAFAGLTANTPWLNTTLGVAMLLGRFVPMVFVLALAGSLAGQGRVPATSGTLPTHRPLFILILVAVTVMVTALIFFPVLALGPRAEGL